MYGIDAISHYNGWAMALAGALIVVTGLALLSFVISQLHKLVAFTDKAGQAAQTVDPPAASDVTAPFIPDRCPANLTEVAQQYRSLTEPLGYQFELSLLYEKALHSQLPHPHLTIRCLREAGMLVPQGDGVFTWSQP